MNLIRLISFLLAINILAFCLAEERIVTVGGSVTEIVFALGAGSSVVAVDQSSTMPDEIKKLPQVGYIRAISSEGVLSMEPTKILTTSDIGPIKAVEQLNKSGVEIEIFDSPYSFDDIINLIEGIASALNLDMQGKVLINKLIESKNEINNMTSSLPKPKIVFFMNPSSGSYTAAGSRTRANYLIDFIGGVNIFSEDFNKYSKVTKEQIISSNPDVILIGSISKGNVEELNNIFLKKTEFESINAVKNNNVFTLDMGKYLTFGSSFPSTSLSLINDINK